MCIRDSVQTRIAALQTFVAYATKVRHLRGRGWRAATALRQSQRDCVLQPKVARNELPWVTIRRRIQPQRGCGHSAFIRRACENGHNPVGVAIFFGRFPKVAWRFVSRRSPKRFGCDWAAPGSATAVPSTRFASCVVHPSSQPAGHRLVYGWLTFKRMNRLAALLMAVLSRAVTASVSP